jgi:hypothetical protein
MLKQPKERTVEFVRPTFISGELATVGTKRAFPTAFAAELVSGGKAKFIEDAKVEDAKAEAKPKAEPKAESAAKGK